MCDHSEFHCDVYTFGFSVHYRDTYVERQPGETANDRNDRAIRVATAWYESHLKKSSENPNQIRVILLTDDKQNLEKARAEGIICSTVRDYVLGMSKYPTLQDKLSLKGFSSQDTKAAIFPPHLTVTDIHEGIKNGKLLQGTFAASRENYLEGYVNVEGIEKSVRKKSVRYNFMLTKFILGISPFTDFATRSRRIE